MEDVGASSSGCRRPTEDSDNEACKRKKQKLNDPDKIQNGDNPSINPTDDVSNGIQINDLPQSLLVNILSHVHLADLLRHVSRVCKYWQALANDPHLWRTLKLGGQLKLTDLILSRLTSLSQNILNLDLTDCRQISTQGLASVLSSLPSLRVIKLVRCQALKDDCFIALGDTCHNLQEAYFDNCYALSDKSLQSISRGCPKLQILSVNHCNMISDTGICAIAGGCLSLSELHTGDCKKLTDQSVSTVTEKLPEIEVLNLSGCSFTVKGILNTKKLSNLKVLDLAHISDLCNSAVISITRNCRKLETINLNLCTHVTDESVTFIARNSPNLTNLYVVACNVTNQSLQCLGEHCKTLEHIDVGWCEAITESGARFLASRCPGLRYLGLMRCDRISISSSITLQDDFPHVQFSTMYLDCKRLYQAAELQGCLPSTIAAPFLQNPPGL